MGGVSPTAIVDIGTFSLTWRTIPVDNSLHTSDSRVGSPKTALAEISHVATCRNRTGPRVIPALLVSTIGLATSRLFLTPARHGSLCFAEGRVAIVPADRRRALADVIAGLTYSFRSKWLGRVEELRRALVPTFRGAEKTHELKDVKSVSSLIQTSIPKMGSRLAQSLSD